VFADDWRWLGIQIGSDPEIVPLTKLATVPYAFRVSTVDGSTGGVISGDVSIQSDLDVDGDLRVTGKATIGPGHTSTGTNAFVAGHYNTVQNFASTVGGGSSNWATEMYSTVSGGDNNNASGIGSTIGGGEGNSASKVYSTVGGGYQNTVDGDSATISGGSRNSATGNNSTIGGGTGNEASFVGVGPPPDPLGGWSTVGGGRENRALGDYSTISGGRGNTAAAGWTAMYGGYSTVAGGQDNHAFAMHSTVSGGQLDFALAPYATVGGGYMNAAGVGLLANPDSGTGATVAGRYGNRAAGYYSTISGGESNAASGWHSTVSGGTNNDNAGSYSAIPGGDNGTLTSNAHHSLVFGRDVYVNAAYRVVFFDSVYSGRLGINRDHRNVGGIAHPIHVGTDGTNGNGAHLTAGGSWQNGSSRSFKEDFQSLSRDELLAKIAGLPVQAWQYKGTDERHIGPVSEDFVDAFDVGVMKEHGLRDNKYLCPGDVAGVALAGVKELIQENQELKQIIDDFRQRIVELEKTGTSR
jgi:hypothetical protein